MTKVDDKREAILQATLRLVSEHGFHGAAMSKVAKEAGVSAGIIYHYFENKDELMAQLYLELKQQGMAAQLVNYDKEQPLRIRIRQHWGEMIRYFIKHPNETAYMNQFMNSPYYTKEVQEQGAAYSKPITDCYQEAKAERIIRNLPQAVFATLAFDVPSSLVSRQKSGQINLTDEIVEQVVESLWQAIRFRSIENEK